ncbi:MAG: S-layer homology domain-containing protein [Clostridia bacterium]|nr:S-layer homology domain-containing protein [Clostridia bacterium]
MKKLLALIMALAMTGSVAAFAQDNSASEEEIMLISEEATEAIPENRIVEGTVTAVSEDQIETEDLIFNIGENTLVADVNLVPTEVKVGDAIYVVASTIETLSIPAQTPAYYVIVKESPEAQAPIFMAVDEVKNGFIYSSDGSYEVSYEEAQVEMYRTKNIVKAEELTKGSEIFVYSDIMTMSIPALVNPEKIVIMSIAQTQETEEAEEASDVTVEENLSDKRIVEGTVKSVSDEQIELDDLVLNLGENTLVADTTLVPTEVKTGDFVTAVVSTAATFSIPAQSSAYYVIVRENAETIAPIFMTVDEVKDGYIYSADGTYKVSYEEAQVEMYRTKNIVKAEELTKGSEIFVYSDIMTMSIPALVNPEKIVIMSIAQEEEISKALALNDLGILLGTDKGLELERDVTRAEAVALIQRTTAADKMVYKSSFDDVADSHWAYNYISWATEKGIVQGVGDNKFEPDRTVTAKELAMMLLNAQGIEAEFEDAFEKATEEGYVTAEDEISEDDTLTRDAVAKMIYNYLNR